MLEAFEPVLIRTPGETPQAKKRKNQPTTYGGMRQTCMHAKMATANAAMLAADGIGSNRISAAPRRGGERIETLSYVIRIATTGQRLKMTSSVLFVRPHCATLCVCAGYNPNTAVLWWVATTPCIES